MEKVDLEVLKKTVKAVHIEAPMKMVVNLQRGVSILMPHSTHPRFNRLRLLRS